jgi:hypothetical protein
MKLVDIGGCGWDYEIYDDDICEHVPFDVYEVKYGNGKIVEFDNAKEAYKSYKKIRVPKVLWGYMKSGFSELLEHHDYEKTT